MTTTTKLIHDLANYATVTKASDAKLLVSCRDDLCEDVESTCEGTGWSVEWTGDGNTESTGRTYEDGTVSVTE